MSQNINESIIQQIASVENLILAWRRVESSFQHGNVWYDEIEISRFKFQLLDNVQSISNLLLYGNYKLHTIVPAPFPKCCDENDNPQVRQSFLVNVADQVVWMAVVNVIGRDFEREMPAWSYGNRLDIPVWKDGNQWKFGDIRTTTKSLYRPWSRSWPLYRKQLTATIKKMAFSKLSDEDQVVVSENLDIDDTKSFLKLPYFQKNYFTNDTDSVERYLYWVGLDLSKFYQNINMSILATKICNYGNYLNDSAFCNLIQALTSFSLDVLNYTDDELCAMQLSRSEPFIGLPTGLVVAGFLANLYLMDIDNEVKHRLESNKNIVHFRYVDDHLFVATSPRVLIDWVRNYIDLLQKNSLCINKEKCEPSSVADLLFKDIDSEERWKDALLDPLYPSPLMTETLQKVSALSALNVDLLTDSEYEMVFNDLQMLMVTDIPEEEIKKGTRISFTSTMLSRMVAQWNCDMEELYHLRENWLHGVNSFIRKNNNLKDEDIKTLVNVAFVNGSHLTLENLNLNPLKKIYGQSEEIKWQIVDKIYNSLKSAQENEERKCNKIFSLLKKALFEVPDKTKIWIRALDFCSLHLPNELTDLFVCLDKLRKDSLLHPLGYEYLFAMLLLRTSHNMVKALSRLTLDNYATPYHHENDRLFLQKALQLSIPNSDHYLIQDATQIYYKACLLCIAKQQNFNLNSYVAEDSFCSAIVYHDYKLGANFWLLWGISLLNKYVPREDQNMKKLYGQFLEYVHPSEPYFIPLICYFMNELRDVDYKVIQFNEPIKDISNINVFEFLYNLKYLPGGSLLTEQVQGYDNVKKKLIKTIGKKWIRLSEWLYRLSKNTDVNSVYQSEYFATKLIYSIAKKIRNELHNDIIILHPFSIKLLSKEMNNYSDWRHWLNNNVTVNLNVDSDVDDSFYVYPIKVLNTGNRRQVYYIYGLGMIFLQIISKRVVMPWVIYRPEVGFEWMSVLRSLMMDGGISTRNFNIIRSCLSERNRENLRMYNLQESFDTNILYDGKTYLSLDDLLEDLDNSIKAMEKNMVSVAGYQTRQLTVIDLKEQV